MKTKILSLFLFGILLSLEGCSNDVVDDPCEWETVNPVSVSDSFKQELDYVFSDNNEIVKNIEGDTLLFVINNDQELKEIGYVGGLSSQAIDFANQTVVWGKILTSSVSDKISGTQLSVCSSTNEYKYEVIIEKCTDCWTAIGYLYFWEIYPKKINASDVSLTIKKEVATQITPVLIAQGFLCGSEDIPQQNMIIKSKLDWENLKKSMNLYNNETDKFIETEIDFSVYQIIAIFDKIRGNGGWSIDITSITEYSDNILVDITHLNTGNETSVITQPYHIVKIPVSEKQIVFQLSGQLAWKWEVKSQNISGELANIILPPENALYSDISIQIPDAMRGSITGNTFYNDIWVDFEINDNQQISFKNYGGSRIAEDGWGRAFEDNLLNTVKFVILNNELIFLDLQDKPNIVFIHK